MKRTTRKLSGAAKDRFLARFFAEEPGLERELARRLVVRSQATFSSVRVRRVARGRLVDRPAPEHQAVSLSPPQATQSVTTVTDTPVTPPVPAAAPTAPAAAFDPYLFGLVPVFQREGREGLLTRLAAIAGVEDLRAMARTQQIVLPEALRNGEAEPGVVRDAIADAVARRIAGRRAAAG